jgi:uridine phosphorylase
MRYITPEALITARLGIRPMPRFRRAILVFHSGARCRYTTEILGGSPLGYKLLSGVGPDEVFLCEDNQTVVVANIAAHGAGGPLTTSLVEELASLGVEALVGVGCAGSLDRSLPRGKQFYAREALCTDGASRVYIGHRDRVSLPSAEIELVEKISDSVGTELVATTGVTVDVLYRETPALVEYWQRLGGQWINLEVTPLYAAAAACGLRAVYLGHISDELFGAEWNAWFGEERDAMAQKTAEVAVALMEAMSPTTAL